MDIPQNKMTETIYDFGANNGDDIPYYLMKADKVVAVEANSTLCDTIKRKFESEIEEGRLVVENCVLSNSETSGTVPFFIHKTNHVLSQFPRPSTSETHLFDEVRLPSRSAPSVIREHGEALYIKIDIEHYDAEILKDMFIHNIFPPYISAESHTIEVFSLLVGMGHYNAFKLIEGRSVSINYACRKIIDLNGNVQTHSFPHHSAGPYGNDVDGVWMTGDQFSHLLAIEGLGWKDIHASKVDEACRATPPLTRGYILKTIIRNIKSTLRPIRNALRRYVLS